MQKNLIVIDKTLGKKILAIFKSPITALVIALLISSFFYFISRSNKTPAYYISSPELIAQKADDKLKIQYNNLEIDNVYSSNLILWNDGDEIIDYNDFIEEKPTKIYSDDSIKILSTSLSQVSRADLKFHHRVINDTILISLANDEAFEEGDGVKFLILFTKSNNQLGNPTFKLNSRIKGTINGFEYKDLANFTSKNNKFSLYILWSVINFSILFRTIFLYLNKKPIVFRKTEAVIIFSLIIITSYMTIKHIFYTTNLNWL